MSVSMTKAHKKSQRRNTYKTDNDDMTFERLSKKVWSHKKIRKSSIVGFQRRLQELEYIRETLHAQARQQQRGLYGGVDDVILMYADRRIPVGRDKKGHRGESWTISPNRVQELRASNIISPAMEDRILKKAIVVQTDRKAITTYIANTKRRQGRHYRKLMKLDPRVRNRRRRGRNFSFFYF